MHLKKFLKRPSEIIFSLGMRYGFPFLDDITYLKLMYRCRFGKRLDLDNPKTFNEKLQWLKLYDRKPEYTMMVDKYEVKKYVAEKIGKEYIIPTLGVWKSFDEIDFDRLPNQFVLKCTHDSGGVIRCKDKAKFDIKSAQKKINRGLKRNYFYSGREWPYKDISPQIIIEKFIGTVDIAPNDYKFFTFNGKIDSIMVCTNRESGQPNFYFYDTDWKRKYYQYAYLEKNDNIKKPDNLQEMIEIVNSISKDYKHVRIDLYNENGKIYFGEITLYNQSGFDVDISPETDMIFGDKIILS